MSDDPTKVCPSCGVEAVRRLINSANFILKGSGWYADLYSGGSNKKSESSGSKVGSNVATPATGDASSSSSSGDGAASSTSSSDSSSAGSSTTAAAPPPPSTTKTS